MNKNELLNKTMGDASHSLVLSEQSFEQSNEIVRRPTMTPWFCNSEEINFDEDMIPNTESFTETGNYH